MDEPGETLNEKSASATAPEADTLLTKENLGQVIEEIFKNLLTPSDNALPSVVESVMSAERLKQLKEQFGLHKKATTIGDDSAVSSSTASVAERPAQETTQPDASSIENDPKPVRRPRKKQMNELEKLQENLDSTFIRDEVLTATGKRACTLEQNQRSVVLRKPLTPTKTKAKGTTKAAVDLDSSPGK